MIVTRIYCETKDGKKEREREKRVKRVKIKIINTSGASWRYGSLKDLPRSST